MPRLARAALALALPALGAAAHIDPAHSANVTIYHVNERNYSGVPRNMNTADVDGDIYFDLRSRGLPLECGPWRNTSFWSRLDCDNPEVDDPSQLTITELVLEVDTRFGDYADCNVDTETGEYYCECENVPDNCTAIQPQGAHACNMSHGCLWDSADGRCEAYGCANITDKLHCVQGYRKCEWDDAKAACHPPPGPPPVCNASLVGFLNLSTVNWGRHTYPGQTMSKVDYWHGNALSKADGFWYSTPSAAECRDDPAQHYCSWRVARAVKRIAKPCSDAAINAAIVHGDATALWGARCYEHCSDADRRNSTSQCWIECFYANVLGPKGSSQLMNRSRCTPTAPTVKTTRALSPPRHRHVTAPSPPRTTAAAPTLGSLCRSWRRRGAAPSETKRRAAAQHSRSREAW